MFFFLQKDKVNAALSQFNQAFNTGIPKLKYLQRSAIEVLQCGKDCICSIPTGYGKSLIYEILPYINPDNIVFVIVPLNANFIEQQVDKLGTKALSFCGNVSDEDAAKLKTLDFSYLFCHPEQALSNK